MSKSDHAFVKVTNEQGATGFIFFVAYIGAVVYFFQQQPDFWGFILALIKAIFWPAFLIYAGMNALHV
jgi:hypothetical protein